jgi:hypothetical protein
MDQQKPNPNPAPANSAKEKPEDPKRRADAKRKPELDGKNDSGVEPEIHGHELPGE